ncbi:leucine--tRNA ligase [Microbacterium sp. A8/3-1]|uniref:Leucine--tRNA ligase n=1 Tax=Microbacterium sp. A8/3-1 TaxID=3160749 RepID=A0AAU7W2F2_9MICO
MERLINRDGNWTLAKYSYRDFEEKWAEAWRSGNAGGVESHPDGESRYVLDMFPYPSGETHMGHVRNYTIGDTLARYHRARGRQVLHPIGYDAFGLPAENAAMRSGISPADWTRANIERFNATYTRLGYSYDWDRVIVTADPSYYRWTQWIFLRMFERDVAYKKEARVNWCPVDKTVLANEQVVDGVCWRCGAVPEQRQLNQWFVKTTSYAQELLEGLDDLDAWPEALKAQQRNWIGRSEGLSLELALDAGPVESVSVYSTRPDTLHGATFVALAVEHPAAENLAAHAGRLEEYRALRKSSAAMSDIERTNATRVPSGLQLDVYATNPATGERLPVFVADYVIAAYGTGSVIGVPAHDERDFKFARLFGLAIRRVVAPVAGDADLPFEAPGIAIGSGDLDGMSTAEAKRVVTARAQVEGWGRGTVEFRLRDWLLSRQRYWGCPIPIVTCTKCGLVPVPDEQLPVLLPPRPDYDITGDAMSPLANLPEWVNVDCPSCGGPAERETDTMDTFIDSSWYFLRFPSATELSGPVDSDATNRWMPVDLYTGGIEHAVGHLIYSRFMTRFLRDVGLLDFDEPFVKVLNQGTITLDGRAMSKSSGHNVDPTKILEVYGADAIRVFILFIGPPDQDYDWPADQVAAVVGAHRFLDRLWQLGMAIREGVRAESASEVTLSRKFDKILAEVIRDYEALKFNTVVSSLMSLLKELRRWYADHGVTAALIDGYSRLLAALAPIAPFITHELAERLNLPPDTLDHIADVHTTEHQPENLTIVVQVDGRLADLLDVPWGTSEAEIREQALASEKTIRSLRGRTVDDIVWVPGRLVNLVTAAVP